MKVKIFEGIKIPERLKNETTPRFWKIVRTVGLVVGVVAFVFPEEILLDWMIPVMDKLVDIGFTMAGCAHITKK